MPVVLKFTYLIDLCNDSICFVAIFLSRIDRSDRDVHKIVDST